MIQSYKDLEVYKKSYQSALEMHQVTLQFPKQETYELGSQLRRAATSIPLNIAEGYGKEDTKGEIKRYLRIAKGSCSELSVLLEICKDVGYIEEIWQERYEREIEEISRMLYGLIKSIK